jgi:hypothetical protein
MFNMAECSRLLGDATSARAQYARYLALEPDGKLAALANQRLASLPAPPPVATTSAPAKPPIVVPVVTAAAVPPVPAQPHAIVDVQRDTSARPPIGALIAGGAGVVVLGATGVLAVRAHGTWADAQTHCIDNRCNATGVELAGNARREANWATATAITGTAALAVGGFLWWRDRKHGHARTLAVTPAVAPSVFGVQVGGGF